MKALTAGNRMIKMFPNAKPDDTVGEIEKLLVRDAKKFETINYIYVTDNENHLVGVVSLKEIFRANKKFALGDLMQTKLVKVHLGVHQEKVANLAIKHNLKAIPVTDKDDHLLGVVPSDVILQILHEEHSEDLLRSAGVVISGDPAKSIISASPLIYFNKRIPWLVLGLLGGVLVASILGAFEDAIKEMLTLAAFIPAIVYMSDAVGSQSQTIFIRSLAIDPVMGIKKYLIREITTGTAIALFLSLLIGAISFIWWEPKILAIILGVSFFITIIASIAVALLIPWIFMRTKIDPAIATGPLATVVRDILGITIYFTVASVMIKSFPA